MERFDPKAAVESILDIFRVQACSQKIKLLFHVKNFLHFAVRQGERNHTEVKAIFR